MLNANLYSVEEKLLDGRTVTIRSMHADDEDLWREVWDKLSDASRYARFFTYKSTVTEKEVIFYTHADFTNHVILIAMLHEKDKLVPAGVARYVVVERNDGKPTGAEFALMVDDEYQGLGIGTLLLRHLAVIGRDGGITHLSAWVLMDNHKMLDVLEHLGLPVEKRISHSGVWTVNVSLADRPVPTIA